jgi:hypothetical protein
MIGSWGKCYDFKNWNTILTKSLLVMAQKINHHGVDFLDNRQFFAENLSESLNVFLQLGTAEGTWVSMAVPSDGSYGTPKDIVFSFPGGIVCCHFFLLMFYFKFRAISISGK